MIRIRKSDERGHAHVHFGALRVLNEDWMGLVLMDLP